MLFLCRLNNTTTDWHRVLKKVRLKLKPLFMKDVLFIPQKRTSKDVFSRRIKVAHLLRVVGRTERQCHFFKDAFGSVSGVLKQHKFVTCWHISDLKVA